MKRAILSLALLCALAAPVWARTAVIVDRQRDLTNPSTSDYSPGDANSWRDQATQHVVGFLSRYGAQFEVYGIDQVKTTWAQTGLIYGIQYDAVIWAPFTYQTTALNAHAACYPCSLTLTDRPPSVPQLFIGGTYNESAFSPSVSCSTGFLSAGADPGGQGPYHGSGSVNLIGTTLKWRKFYNQSPPLKTIPAGGFRVISGANESADQYLGPDRDSTFMVGFASQTIYGNAASFIDTTGRVFLAEVTEKQARTISGTTYSPIVFCQWAAGVITEMGGPVSAGAHINGDPFPIYLAIAHLDSLSGFKVLGTTRPEPVRFAVQLDGLCARNGAATGLGFAPNESTTVYASLDSLSALRVPIAVGVNVDSARTYLRDVNRAKSMTTSRFTPWSRTGIDSTANSGAATSLTSVDIVGRYRLRGFVRPDGSAAADTSLRNNVRWALWRVDSIFGGHSRVGMFPDEDWSPKNMTLNSGERDSLVYALRLGGLSGVSVNIESDSLNTTGSANPVGLSADPQFVSVLYGDRSAFGFIGYTRLPGAGSPAAFANNGEGGAPGGSTTMDSYALKRMWMSQYEGRWRSPQKATLKRHASDWTEISYDQPTEATVSDIASEERPVNILRISMSNLGAGTTSTALNPNRPGFYAVKYLRNMCYALNTVAGRNLAIIVYPDDLGPGDLH